MSKYWFCTKHHAVEEGEQLCPPIDRLGPYESYANAAAALEKAAARNEAWDNDPNWSE